LGAHALHREIEPRGVFRRDIVVVDAGAQKFPGARTQRPQSQPRIAGGQLQRRAARAVHHAHHQRFAAAVVEELLDGVAERARLPQAAEHMLEFRESRDENRPVDRSAQCAPDECGARRALALYRSIRAAFFFYLDACVDRRHQNTLSQPIGRPRGDQDANSAMSRRLSKGTSSMPAKNPPMCARNATLEPPRTAKSLTSCAANQSMSSSIARSLKVVKKNGSSTSVSTRA